MKVQTPETKGSLASSSPIKKVNKKRKTSLIKKKKSKKIERTSLDSVDVTNSSLSPEEKTKIEKYLNRVIDTEDFNLLKTIYNDDIKLNLQHQQEPQNSFLIQEEKFLPHCQYLKHQKEITPELRTDAINFILNVCRILNCSQDVFYGAVNLLERYMSKRFLKKGEILLYSLTCFYISIKVVDKEHPTIKQVLINIKPLLYNSDEQDISKEQILAIEYRILSALNFNIEFNTTHFFLAYINKSFNNNDLVQFLSQYIMETTLFHEEFIGVKKSLIAASAFDIAIKMKQPKNNLIKYFSPYKQEEIHKVSRMIIKHFFENERGVCIKQKYCQNKYLNVSRIVEEYIAINNPNKK